MLRTTNLRSAIGKQSIIMAPLQHSTSTILADTTVPGHQNEQRLKAAARDGMLMSHLPVFPNTISCLHTSRGYRFLPMDKNGTRYGACSFHLNERAVAWAPYPTLGMWFPASIDQMSRVHRRQGSYAGFHQSKSTAAPSTQYPMNYLDNECCRSFRSPSTSDRCR